MQASQRISGILGGGSDGWDVFNKAREMIDTGTPVTELTIGEHDIRTAAPILQEMHRAALAGHTGYASIPGVAALRREVAQRVQERTGVPTTSENVMITPGGQSALFAAHIATCDAGDTALYLDPFYATYPGTIRGAGATPLCIQTHAEDAFQPRASDIAAHAKGAKSLLINTPNNPTGVVYSRATLDGIAQVCREEDLWLISDEVYDTQVWEGEHISPRALDGMAERTLVVGSMSKSHAMTGSRIGWVVGPRDIIDNLINLATHTTYGVPGFIQDAALFALQLGEEFEAEIAAPFRRRRDIAHKVLAGQNAVSLVPAQGAMYLMLDVRSTGMTGEDFAFALLEAHQIAVMPGESFGTAAAGHVRVAMTIEDSAFEAALKTLCSFAQSCQNDA
ncbi:pyridoxal phosphate-dependent aminotransferase [Sulfitobacter geojensis]|uniref:Aminotransferase n=1 Tax=Sulfitobacter geojensis TaxID=1342299 RepID=A0AAE2VV97_9RHOB|nr:pyridoxal phosphate-dependent aminotransferase [Sulfitobacter geojensis]MBM1688020.1 pyridoxal phosphate-dependent aminotransferase [Sulfitobacter geojensis]MBM1692087.1 pyridoxal phosphate-dependent aminotransferase [Sulfitobacter geojensis]MBM1704253.1 pyridoxal phosphate-dependent aminotransferase [Sulfitobacter geojensis]MBM1708311.1 pyridoxal phosphate-dependent aminotransferase [Sulfitobacter geojensis]MBM1712376.1 pyridoxal phosphate-dependent aminotransferase [Sulfitobacter geojensi